MVSAELGTKRSCPSCGTRFYDLLKNPIICPNCGVSFVAEALLPSKGEHAGPIAKVREAVVEHVEPDDVELVSLEDVEEGGDEAADIEDVDIGEDPGRADPCERNSSTACAQQRRPVVMGPRADGVAAAGISFSRVDVWQSRFRAPITALPGPPLSARLTTPQVWGIVLLAPYILVFLAFVVYPVGYGLWLARHPASYVALWHDPIFARAAVNTLIFLVIGINVKMAIALFLSGFFAQQRTWIKWLSVLFILPWAVPSIPTILSVRFMFNPEWGVVNQLIFKFTGEDGPNWLNDPTVALTMAIGVHIWKSLPFWTLILMTGRLAIPHDLYEAAEVDGASWSQKFRFITWPSMQTLYITCTLLSMIWTLGDFNSVYLLTGGGPADLTHVLATLGIRYLRLDQLSLAMASIVCALPFVLPLVYFMMKRLSR